MPYTNADARRQLLDELAAGAHEIGVALAFLGEAYELMDEHSADRLEQELFRPVQLAYGRAKRSHAEFAGRHGLPVTEFEPPSPAGRPRDAKDAIERAISALHGADETLSTLQDSMLPVEVGDRELRAGLSEVRDLISTLPSRSRELLRTLGR
jgi:hypothetical protein